MSAPPVTLGLILSAIQNFTIITALILIYNFIPYHRHSRSILPNSLRIGILFGFIAAVSTPVLWGGTGAPVIGFNVVLVPLAALFGGPLASVIVAATLIAVSTMVTGTFSVTSIVTVTGMVLLGSLFHYRTSWKWLSPSSLSRLVLLGLGVALIEMGSFLFPRVASPSSAAPASGPAQDLLPVLVSVLPYLVISFLGTIIFGSLIHYISRKKQADEELRAAYQQIAAAEEELRQQYNELAESNRRTRESEEKYRAVVTQANDGIFILQDGVFRFVNPKAAELHGCGAEELTGTPFIDFIHPRDRERVKKIRQNRMNGGTDSPVYETTIVKKDGDAVDVEVNAGTITFEGRPADLVFIRDVTERKRTQKALDHAKKKLNLLNYVTFTDIRNQVFTLLGYQQLLSPAREGDRAGPLIGKEKEILLKIDDSLKFAQTYQDLGLKPARWQNVNQAFLMGISHVNLRNIQHSVTTGGLEIFADPMLEWVFEILADNTLAHSETGTVIRLGYVEQPDKSLTLVFSDDGVGIPDADKSKIFLPEFQKKKSMGLFLAREILETTEITIQETGTPGKGVRFEMRVPKGAFRFDGLQ